MERLYPYLRQIFISDHLPNKDFVKAYDCRFFFVLSGKGELLMENERFPLSENTLAYYPSGLSYFLSSSADEPLMFVTVNFDFTRSYPRRVESLRPVRSCDFLPDAERPTQTELGDKCFCSAFTIEHAFSLRDDFVSLCALFKKQEPYTEELCSALLKCIILKILNHIYGTATENKVVRQVIDYIEENYTESLDNNTVATHFGYHPYYLSSLFKLSTGKTLHQYISDMRLKFGADMLLHTDLSVAQVAARCGFQSASHFSVKFKKQYKESPSSWRQLGSII